MRGVEAAALKKSRPVRRSTPRDGNIWERPCGEGQYHESSSDLKMDTKKKKNHIKVSVNENYSSS